MTFFGGSLAFDNHINHDYDERFCDIGVSGFVLPFAKIARVFVFRGRKYILESIQKYFNVFPVENV
jgi:hypothetical protein